MVWVFPPLPQERGGEVAQGWNGGLAKGHTAREWQGWDWVLTCLPAANLGSLSAGHTATTHCKVTNRLERSKGCGVRLDVGDSRSGV